MTAIRPAILLYIEDFPQLTEYKLLCILQTNVQYASNGDFHFNTQTKRRGAKAMKLNALVLEEREADSAVES